MFIFPMWIAPKIPTDCDLPPTLYAMLNSIVNFGKEDKTKIEDLASAGRSQVFNFKYPLSEKVKKEDFEVLILNHFMMRRLGYETYTSWHIALNTKLNEIMPKYNKLLDVLEGWNIFEDGEVVERTTDTTNKDNTSSNNEVNMNTTGQNISDRRYSDTPQDQLSDVRAGRYITEYNYDTDNNTTTSSSTGLNESETNGQRNEIETIKRSPADKINIYKEYLESVQNIYSMIFKELDCLFYQLG